MDTPVVDRVAIATKRAPPTDWLSVTRAVGLGLLGVCVFAALRLHASVTVRPLHPPTLAEMLLSLVVIVTGMSGAMATLIGPALFRSHPRQPRSEP